MLVWDHPFRTYAKFSKKNLAFPTPNTRAYQGSNQY